VVVPSLELESLEKDDDFSWVVLFALVRNALERDDIECFSTPRLVAANVPAALLSDVIVTAVI